MKITIFGAGYVGLVTAVCFADMGNDVVCVDIDADKVARLQRGESPIYEPGLEALLSNSLEKKRVTFTTDVAQAVTFAEVIFIAVGTPQDEDGSADLQYVVTVAAQIAEYIDGEKVIVNKSTVPVGTADLVRDTISKGLKAQQREVPFHVVSNPEFLKEGDAIADFMKPDRIIIGSDNDTATNLMQQLYAPFNRNHQRVMVMDVRSAELTKYAANAMLATKISFMNEMSNLAERLGADIENVRLGMGADRRIGYDFTYPGCGYGGSCFPKDVVALQSMARENAYDAELLNAVANVNQRQKQRLVMKLKHSFSDDLNDKTIAVWGLAFKPNTDDMREASSRVLLDELFAAGAKVRAFDPVAMAEAKRLYATSNALILCDDMYACLEQADALVIVTEWHQFRSPDFSAIKRELKQPLVFDGRNLYDPNLVASHGLQYYAIGRGLNEFSQ